jgi:thiamine biosynthesis lipoprotein
VRDATCGFRAFGGDVRLRIGAPLRQGSSPPDAAAGRERDFVLEFSDRLAPYNADGDLARLNEDRRAVVPTSGLLRAAVVAALRAASGTWGLIDPTSNGRLDQPGRGSTDERVERVPLAEALRLAPERQRARANPAAPWRSIAVDGRSGTVERPAGLTIDLAAVVRGLCADAVATRLAPYERYVVDCGGAIAVGGLRAQLDPHVVEPTDPLTGRRLDPITVGSGAIATCRLDEQLWLLADGAPVHDLLDPATGRPVWSSVISATALAPSALEASTLARFAVLCGPSGARRVLGR